MSYNVPNKPSRRFFGDLKRKEDEMYEAKTGRSRKAFLAEQSDFVTRAYHDIMIVLRSDANKPLMIVCLLTAVLVVVLHIDDPDNGPIGTWAHAREKNVFAQWVVKHFHEVLAAFIFLPVVLTLPDNIRLPLCALLFVWIVYVPEYSMLEYTLQAIGLHLFFRVRTFSTRALVAAVVIAGFALGYLGHIPTDATLLKVHDQHLGRMVNHKRVRFAHAIGHHPILNAPPVAAPVIPPVPVAKKT